PNAVERPKSEPVQGKGEAFHMTIRKRRALPFALAVAALGAMVLASAASATHPRPLAASPIVASLVPSFTECTGTGNRTHGPPLVFPSCNPPTQSSGQLTVGTSDANGASPNFVGKVRYSVVPGNAATPADEADVKLVFTMKDVRNK